MPTQEEVDSALATIYSLTLTLMGRTQAHEIYLTTLVDTIIDHSPELLEPFKTKFRDVSELHRALGGLPKLALESFDSHVERLTKHFELMRGGGFFEGR